MMSFIDVTAVPHPRVSKRIIVRGKAVERGICTTVSKWIANIGQLAFMPCKVGMRTRNGAVQS